MVEFNREKTNINLFEKIILLFASFIHGILYTIGGFEGGSQYIIVWPILFVLVILLLRNKKRLRLNWWDYPYSLFFILSLSICLLLTPVFGFIFGFKIQPEADLGWQFYF